VQLIRFGAYRASSVAALLTCQLLQRALLSVSLTRCLAELGLASNAPSQLKALALLTLADILRGSPPNQQLFTDLEVSPLIPSTYDAESYTPNEEPRWERAQPVPAILALVATAVEGDPGLGHLATSIEGLRTRAAAVACFEVRLLSLFGLPVAQ
jgi:hypothetical protein